MSSLTELAIAEVENYREISDADDAYSVVVGDLDAAEQALRQYADATPDAARFEALFAGIPDWIRSGVSAHLAGNAAAQALLVQSLAQTAGTDRNLRIMALLQDQPRRAAAYLDSIGNARQALRNWQAAHRQTAWNPAGLKVIESFVASPARQAAYGEPPTWVSQSPAWEAAQALTPDLRLYRHQAKALEILGNDENLVVSTGTASGKSLIFQTYATDLLLRNPQATAIAIYPIRALSRDQMHKWRTMFDAAGLGAAAVGILDGSDPKPTDWRDQNIVRRERLESVRLCLMTPDIIQAWLLANAHDPDAVPESPCPQCGAVMAVQTNRTTGDQFWGCTRYRAAGCKGSFNIGGPTNDAVRKFIHNLELIIIDEAHNYESAFGTNMAYLMRRLIELKHRLTGNVAGPKLIAASATIASPERHMQRLTRQAFTAVTEDDNGAPKAELTMVHIPVSEQDRYDVSVSKPETAEHIADSLKEIIAANPDLRFIAFSDSRQRVEVISSLIERTEHIREIQIIEDSDLVLSYQADHSANARDLIERRLQNSGIPGVVSTSALEMGIDIADLALGINIGKPKSVSSLRQRAGRVGRTRPATFVVITPQGDFAMDGGLQAYWSREIDEAYFYDENAHIKGVHALCAAKEQNLTGEELSDIAVTADADTDAALTETDISVNSDAAVAAVSPAPAGSGDAEFAELAVQAAASDYDAPAFETMRESEKELPPAHLRPHTRYNLRGELDPDVKITRRGERDDEEGSRSQLLVAMNDAYPLATYRYMKQSYRIQEWLNYEDAAKETEIIAVKQQNLPTTKAIHQAGLELSLSDERVLTKTTPCGSLSVSYGPATSVEKIVGAEFYRNGRWQKQLYCDEKPPIPEIARPAPTTATVITIDPNQVEMNDQRCQGFADDLRVVLSHLNNIRIEDLMLAGGAEVKVSANGESSPCIGVAVWDRYYGGLGLTRPLYREFSRHIQALLKTSQRPPQWLAEIGRLAESLPRAD